MPFELTLSILVRAMLNIECLTSSNYTVSACFGETNLFLINNCNKKQFHQMRVSEFEKLTTKFSIFPRYQNKLTESRHKTRNVFIVFQPD